MCFSVPVGRRIVAYGVSQKIGMLEQKIFASPLNKDPRLPELYTQYKQKQESLQRIRDLKKRIQATHDVLRPPRAKPASLDPLLHSSDRLAAFVVS